MINLSPIHGSTHPAPLSHKGTERSCLSDCLAAIWRCFTKACAALVNFLFCRSTPIPITPPPPVVVAPPKPLPPDLVTKTVAPPSAPPPPVTATPSKPLLPDLVTKIPVPPSAPPPPVIATPPKQTDQPLLLAVPVTKISAPPSKAPPKPLPPDPMKKILALYTVNREGWLHGKRSNVSTGISAATLSKIVEDSAKVLPGMGHKIQSEMQEFLVFKTPTLHIYSLVQKKSIGSGSEATIFKVFDVTADQFIALKEPGLKSEVDIMKRLIPDDAGEYHYFEYTDSAKKAVMISPLEEGNLSQCIARLTEKQRLDCCGQLLNKLEILAIHKYYFGDLKDTNCLFSLVNGRIMYRLCDVGGMQDLAKFTPDFHSSYTPRFMHKKDYSRRVQFRKLDHPTTGQIDAAKKFAYAMNIFALGTLFYQVLMGESRFPHKQAQKKTPNDKDFQIGDENSAATDLRAKKYHEGLCSLVKSMTESEYTRRPSIVKIRKQLQPFLIG